ncbi:MAG: acetyl-CoA carboxylase, biotin carboxyl carrier protein, partial [Spirochaetota bacterium]|nr:acetyl-CoA carboxylase, biotin carboxyl carrier protein [Spirochaetota bacterium]
MVGTFYRAPSPDAEPFAREGDMVSHDSTVCIIEAMKMMNEIKAELSGKVIKFLVKNGDPVQPNQPLLLIESD